MPKKPTLIRGGGLPETDDDIRNMRQTESSVNRTIKSRDGISSGDNDGVSQTQEAKKTVVSSPKVAGKTRNAILQDDIDKSSKLRVINGNEITNNNKEPELSQNEPSHTLLHLIDNAANNENDNATATNVFDDGNQPDAKASSSYYEKYATQFTPEEQAIYDAEHAPLGERIRMTLSDMWLPILVIAVIAMSVMVMFIMRFSNTLLVVSAVVVAVILMGTLIYLAYDEQKKVNVLADRAALIYEQAMAIKGNSGKDDESDAE